MGDTGTRRGAHPAHSPVFSTTAGADKTRENLVAFKKAHAASAKHRSRPAQWEHVDDATEAKNVSRVTDAIALNKGPGGSWHPHRGTTALLRLALESPCSDFRLLSWTPVMSLEQVDGSGWSVDCGTRGQIKAPRVVLCTNAYTRHLFQDDLAAGQGVPAQ